MAKTRVKKKGDAKKKGGVKKAHKGFIAVPKSQRRKPIRGAFPFPIPSDDR